MELGVSVTRWALEGLLLPVIGFLGLLGNSASVLVLRQQGLDLKHSFCQILTMLAVFDSVFVVTSILAFSLPLLSTAWHQDTLPLLLPLLLPCLQIAMNGSIWSVVALAWERCTSVVCPTSSLSQMSGPGYILSVTLFSTAWNLPRFFELYTCTRPATRAPSWNSSSPSQDSEGSSPSPDSEGSSPDWVLEVCPTELRASFAYSRDYVLLGNLCVMLLLPFLLISVTNLLLWRTVSRSSARQGTLVSHQKRDREVAARRAKRDREVAALLVTVVLVFLLCHSFRMVINIYEVIHLAYYGDTLVDWPPWSSILTSVSHLALVTNSSTNILIYCWKDAKFRAVLLRWLRLSPRAPPQAPQPSLARVPSPGTSTVETVLQEGVLTTAL